MGHKKRSVVSRAKPSPAPDAVALVPVVAEEKLVSVEMDGKVKNEGALVVVESNLSNPVSNSESYASVKLECEKALNSLRRGNHTKALRLMKEMCAKNEGSAHSALIYRVQGTVCVKVASLMDDLNAKQRYLKSGIESAKKAATLAPNSIEFAHFYANLLYESASEPKDYEEVVQECERALAVENPIDPGKENLQDESQLKLSTAEVRIGNMKNELRSLIQKSNISSISSWMKNLGTGDEKFRLIPLRRVPEDPMELKMAQTKRPNEIKKASKTPEERRKEIEVRVAAARLLQQKSEAPNLQADGDKVLESSSGSGQRVGDRRKSGNARKTSSSAERKSYVLPYWKSMSLDMKKDLLKIRISELKAHFKKDGLAYDTISEALSFSESNKGWKFWICCRCNEKFSDPELHMHHIVQVHMDNLLPKMQSVIPPNIDNEWIEMLLTSPWKPLDAQEAIKMLELQSNSHPDDFSDRSSLMNNMEESSDCFTDSYCSDDGWYSSSARSKFGNSCNGVSEKGREYSKLSDGVWNGHYQIQGFKGQLNPDSWPLSDDSERAKLLEKIQSIFQLLIRHKYLAASHLNKVIQFTVEELNSQLVNCGVDQSPLCICFLGADELKNVLKFLQDLSHSCGLGRYSEKGNIVDDSNISTQVVEMIEKVVFDEDASCLLLEECFPPSKLDPTPCHEIVTRDSDVSKESAEVLDDEAFLSWIFSGPTSGEQLPCWVRTKEEKSNQGVEILQMLEKELGHLQNLCERKCEHLSYEEALQTVEEICVEENKRRENATDIRRSYESVLRKRRDDLIENESEFTFISNRYELKVLDSIIKDAESLNVNQFGFDDTYNGINSQICDLEAGEDNDWRAKDYLQQVDSCIEVAIQRQKEQLSNELSRIDARIMRSVSGMQQLEAKLDPASALDYRFIIVPLIKSFLRARLEDLAEKDATEKSDAAREAFLAELAEAEKLKDKKKNKEYKKTKDAKTTGNNELNMVPHETAENIDGEHPESGGSVAEMGDTYHEQEDEMRRREIELEAEERKLEETLEYQRRIENEAKQKHLAEQHRHNSRAISGNAAPRQSDSHLKGSDDECDLRDQPKHSSQKTLKSKNGFPSDLEDVSVDVKHEAFVRSEESIVHSDQRTGRRGKRHKNSSKVIEEKQLIVSSERRNLGGCITTNGSLEGSCYSEENGTKTLRQLHVEEDDEERFQADLKQAVRQSLDTFQARHKFSSNLSSTKPQNMFVEGESRAFASTEASIENVNGGDVYGTGLINEVGEYNCFLNVIIQSLWHLRRFRDEFMRRSTSSHLHVGDPCVTCALHDIFVALSMASSDTRGEAVAPSSLRIALSNLYPDSSFFQEAQMNDASEVLGVIFDCLHRSFTSGLGVSDTESVDSNGMGSWDCANSSCLAHSLFGMNIFERMNCYGCGLESRHLKYTSFFHNINASALRTMKVMCPESTFDELLNLVEMNHQLTCDPEAGGCGKLNYIHHILSTRPHVFTTVLGWQNTCESVEDIRSTLSALATDIDICSLYRGLDPKIRHHLVSVVCYYGQHYHCFAYSHDHERWVMYDDKTVKVIGCWEDVLIMCERGHLQPQVLLYEAVN